VGCPRFSSFPAPERGLTPSPFASQVTTALRWGDIG
jgi:hypothetical protein